jgi:hypothetical protein
MAETITPQPMNTAPKDGGWVLGLVLPDGPTDTHWQPWKPLTWSDGFWANDAGWHDDDGNRHEPAAWVPIPDPQPKITGWRPAEGTIYLSELPSKGWTCDGKPVEVPYRWQVYIERTDGTFDEYRDCAFLIDREAGDARAARWAEKFGLPVVVVLLPSNVVQFPGGVR